MGSIHVGGSKKTSSTATNTVAPNAAYQPFIDAGAKANLDTFNQQQPNLNAAGQSATNVYNGLGAAQSAAANIYTGQSPAQATYAKLQNAGANDPSLGLLSNFASGPDNNPALGLLQGMSHGAVNGDTSQYYKDAIGGKYLDNNPYIDKIAQQGEDAALKSINQRFAASGMGEGMSSPYTAAAGDAISNANNNLRYQNYTTERGLQQAAAGMSDSEYNSTQDRNLSAAGTLGSQYNTGQQQKLAAAQALGSQNTADNATALNGANGSVNSILSALGMSGQLSQDQIGALTASAGIPLMGVNAYSNNTAGLLGKYTTGTGSSTGTEKSSPGLFDWMSMFGQNAASAAKMGG